MDEPLVALLLLQKGPFLLLGEHVDDLRVCVVRVRVCVSLFVFVYMH